MKNNQCLLETTKLYLFLMNQFLIFNDLKNRTLCFLHRANLFYAKSTEVQLYIKSVWINFEQRKQIPYPPKAILGVQSKVLFDWQAIY